MEAKDARYVLSCIENEGFHYAFMDYWDFEHITDTQFHMLRDDYLRAISRMEHYLKLSANKNA